MEQEQLQEKFMQFRTLQEHIEQISEHLERLNAQNIEIEDSKQSIEDLGKVKSENEMLTPVANGIFVKAKLSDASKMLVNVGADTVVEKTREQVVELLGKQQKQLTEKVIEAQGILDNLQSQAMQIYEEIQQE